MTNRTKPPDEAQQAVESVAHATDKAASPLPPDLEAAWTEWSRGLAKVDDRGMTLLRAAFEAGYDVGRSSKQ